MLDPLNNPGDEVVESLFAEFNECLRVTGEANFSLLDACPPASRRELRSLMNVAVLAYRALQQQREETSLDGRRKVAAG